MNQEDDLQHDAPEEVGEGFRLSPQQERLWAERRRHPGSWQKTIATVRVEGQLARGELERAVEEVVDQLEILRTRLVTPEGSTKPLQVIGDPGVEWAEAPTGDGDVAHLERIFEAAQALEVDPVEGPLLGVLCAPLGPEHHALALVLPSLLADAASLVNLVGEIASALGGQISGAEEAEEEILQYADLAEWQNELLESEETEGGRRYWEEMGWPEMPSPRLPFGVERGVAGLAPLTVTRSLDTGLLAGLQDLADGVSARAFFLACWRVLLARLEDGEAAALAVEYDGRRYEEVRSAVGVFSRRLPLLSDYEADRSLADFSAEIARRDTELSQWQESFDVASSADAPFSRVQFGYRRSGPGDLLAEGPLTFRLERMASWSEASDLALWIHHGTGGVSVELTCNASLLGPEAADLLVERYIELVRDGLSSPSRPVSELRLLGGAERERLLAGHVAPMAETAAPGFMALFSGQATRDPEATALVFGERRMTYGELRARVNRLAHHLAGAGAGPETRVALWLDRSFDLVIALLAVLETGAAFVPLDPTTPRERLEALLETSRARLLISTGAFVADQAAGGAQAVVLDEVAEKVAREPDSELGRSIDESVLAYVIFTSGSTGQPKPVGVERRQLAHYVRAILARLEPGPGASFATVSAFSADLGYTAVFPALASGGSLHVLPRDLVADPQKMAEYCRSWPIDVLKISPSHLSAHLAAEPTRDLLPKQRLVLGGEALRPELIERVLALDPECTLFNHYGPTESTVGVSTFRIEPGALPVGDTVPIGRPLGHARLPILDRRGEWVPLGSLGEIYLGGAGLSRGYLERPAATAERFVPDPHSKTPGARLYRTGDKARRPLSGDVVFLGRVDDQLKIRGFRVEPGEIEKALEEHPAIRAAKVIGREKAPGDVQLLAYLAVDRGHAAPLQRLLELRAGGELRKQPLFDLPSGQTVAHVNEGETRYLYREIFGEQSYLKHGIRIPEGGCVLDIGASIGLFSLLASRWVKGGKVLAFEPVPQVFRALRLNAEIHGGIRAFNFGLSDSNREAEITCYPHLTLMSSLYADHDEERAVMRAFLRQQGDAGGADEALIDELLEDRLSTETCPVSLRRLSEVLREEGIERVDLLKIDAQKSEQDILAGIDEEDWPKIRQVVLEVHDLEGRLSEIVTGLENRGFEVAAEQEKTLADSALFTVYARRLEEPAAEGEATEVEPSLSWSSPGILIDDLRQYLRSTLPEHMVPSSLSLMAELPLTANGKVDRKALPEPESLDFDQQRVYEAPGTATERKLVEIWSSVLGGQKFGIRDNFFEIGGHSLLATQVVARIRKDFEVEVTLRDFFDNPTIAEIARKVEAAEPLAADQEERINRLVRAAYRRGKPPGR